MVFNRLNVLVFAMAALLGMLTLLTVVSPEVAKAEGNCPEGHYPALDPGTGKQTGCAPIPGYQQPAAPGQPSAPRRPPPPAAYIALYWHPDANDVWAAWTYGDDWQAAGRAAHNACAMIAGSGCQMGLEGSNMAIVVGRFSDGKLAWASGKSQKKARANLTKYCVNESKNDCSVVHQFPTSSPHGGAVPQGYSANSTTIDPTKRRFAVGTGSDWNKDSDDLWVASGVTNAAGARFLPREYCRRLISYRHEGQYCNRFPYDSSPFWSMESGYALIFRDSSGSGNTVVGANRDMLERQANEKCMQLTKAACAAGVLIDTRTPFTGLISYSKLPAWPKGGRPVDFDPAAPWLEWQMGKPLPPSAIKPFRCARGTSFDICE